MAQKNKDKVAGRKPGKYDEAFKRMVIGEYRSGRWSMEQLRRRYGLAGKSCISEWISQLERLREPAEREVWRDPPPMAKNSKKDSVEDLRRRIRDLERRLDDEQLRNEAYLRLIDLAEREHRIEIRKKAGTK